MKQRVSKGGCHLAAVLVIVALLALCQVGCGGSSSSSGNTAGEGQPAEAGANETGSSKRNDAGSSTSKPEFAEEEVGGYGSEASGTEERSIISAEHHYLEAMAAREFAQACSMLSVRVTRSLERFGPPQARKGGCSAILPKMLSPSVSAVARQQLEGQVRKVRVKGKDAFVIFHAPGARLFVFPLVQNAGAWKLGTLTSSILAPSAATLGE